jgi:phosphoribosylformylglycinamidine cyclo-ligase
VGLESSGLHSNGYTLARKALDMKKWGSEMLKPTKIYASTVLEIIDACDVHGIGHITGGGFSKLTRLNNEVGYKLDNLPKPKPIFEALAQKVGSFSEMHRTFNMGVGMCIILPADRADTVINIAKKHSVESSIIGSITDKKGVFINDGKKEIDISIEGG